MSELRKIDKILLWYKDQPWIRAIIQIPPGGGSVDLLLSHRATKLNQERFEKFLQQVSDKLSVINESLLDRDFLQSEEFFELLRRCAEIVAHTANEKKRELVAQFLSGTIRQVTINDLSGQILEDLNILQPLHLQILAALPDQAGIGVSRSEPPSTISNMEPGIYQKGIADLERLGFISFTNKGIGTFNGGSGHWETTIYLILFKKALMS